MYTYDSSRLVIRGANDDFAALCTFDQVFKIKLAETSNTLLFASPLDFPAINKENRCVSLTVTSILHSKYKLTLCVPKLKRIRELLESNPYRGQFDDDGNDEEHPKAKITINDLRNEVQASDNAIDTYLKKLNVVIVEGYLRLLDFDFRTKLVEYIQKTNRFLSNKWRTRRRIECIVIGETRMILDTDFMLRKNIFYSELFVSACI